MGNLDIIEFIGIWCKNRQIVGGLCIAEYTYEFNEEDAKFTIVNVYNKYMNTEDLDIGEMKRLIMYIEDFKTEKLDVLEYFKSVIKDLKTILKNK